MGKCRSKGREKKQMGGGLYSRSWYQEGLEANPIQFVPHSIQVSCRRLHVSPHVPTHPPHPLSHCSTPHLWPHSLVPSSHLTLLGREHSNHTSPQGKGNSALPPWGLKVLLVPEGQRWETPFASLPSSSSYLAFLIIPLQRLPTLPRNTRLTNNSYHPTCFH